MQRHNPENERVKRSYLRYLREARGRSEKTLNKVAADLDRFELLTGRRDFKRFTSEQAEAFKRALCEQVNERTGEPLSKSTIMHVAHAPREFF
jgi:site-specific recombinase XerD